MRWLRGLGVTVLTLALMGVACSQRQAATSDRPTTWAAPLDHPPLTNFHRVAPGLYRGAQPTAAGMAELENLGIRMVVNLRGLHSDRELLERTGLAYRHITFQTWHPEDEDIVEFLRLVTQPANQPVFVHCQHGSDRTGTMCAVYRMAVQGWSRDEAIREMTEGGYGFHTMWSNLIDYLRRLDVPQIAREAGL